MIGDALVENNLFIGNSPAQQAAPMQFKGVQGVEVRANTVVGDFVAGAFGFRIGTEQDNLPITDIVVRQNVFDDPTGTMADRLFNIYGDYDLGTFVLDHNLYWNEGNALPSGGALTPADDSNAVEADPGLPDDQVDIVLPRWDLEQGVFESGEATVRDEFLRLVETYGALADGSAAIAAADPAHMPTVDIRGYPRDAQPDLGAYEHGAQDGDDGGDDGGTGDGGDGTGGDGTGGDGTDAGATTGSDGVTEDGGDDTGGASQEGNGCNCKTAGQRGWALPLLALVVAGRRRGSSA
jgi:MYXO-CTERM domain-containing protein